MEDNDQSETVLEEHVGEASWAILYPHFKKGILVQVDSELNLIEAASAVVADDTKQVQAWINSGKLSKPDMDQAMKWAEQPELVFQCIIAKPYILFQLPAPAQALH